MSYHYPQQPTARRTSTVLPLFLAGAALVLTGWMAYERFWPSSLNSHAVPRAIEPRGELADFEKATIKIFEQNAPSVVHITSPEVRVRWTDYSIRTLPAGTGSGFIWDERGYVVTNYHVIEGRQQVDVRLLGTASYKALVVGIEPILDIAVLKLTNPPHNLRPTAIGTSRDLRVGQSVFAIGNPYGLSHTLSTGVVSALDRVIESVRGTPIEGVIQVDADINPGNSGGPLLDSAGRLIGMNTAIKSPTGASTGIGFAVPIDTINRVAPRLISGDSGQRPALGISIDRRGLVRLEDGYHPVISEVVPNSGAAEAGLRGHQRRSFGGDIILSIDSLPVNRIDDIHGILEQRQLGDTVKVEILRISADGERERRIVNVKLQTEVQRDGR